MSVRIDRVQLAIRAAISTATDAIGLWAPSTYPRRPSSGENIITAQAVRGPDLIGLRAFCSSEPTVVRWTIASAAVDSRVGIAITGARWTYDVAAGNTDEDVRDALLALFTADARQLPGVTIAAFGTDSIDFTSTGGVLGLLWSPTAIGPGVTVTATTEVDAEALTGRADYVLELHAYATGPGPNAQTLLGNLLGAMSSHDMLALRDQYGVVLSGAVGDVVNLTSLAGADWESRAMVRIGAALRSYRAVAVDPIEDITSSTITLLNGAEQIGVGISVDGP